MCFVDFGDKIDVRRDEPLYKHSTFRIGGPAKYALFPENQDQLIYALNVCKNKGERYFIAGNGSNLLFDDNGFDGAVIFTTKMSSCQYLYKDGAVYVTAECGKSLTELSGEVGKKHSLCGLEFAYGIPGTVGGAIYMNAGAYGGQMSDVVFSVDYLDTSCGEVNTVLSGDLDLSYRHSMFQDHTEYLILSTTLRLCGGNAEEIFAAMSKNMTSRKEKQPLELPNAGSTFKRPGENIFVGKLIEDAGLKGFSIGGAQISSKHAGFTVNKGGATASDVLMLIEHTQSVIKEKYGVSLESEIIYVPYK